MGLSWVGHLDLSFEAFVQEIAQGLASFEVQLLGAELVVAGL